LTELDKFSIISVNLLIPPNTQKFYGTNGKILRYSTGIKTLIKNIWELEELYKVNLLF